MTKVLNPYDEVLSENCLYFSIRLVLKVASRSVGESILIDSARSLLWFPSSFTTWDSKIPGRNFLFGSESISAGDTLCRSVRNWSSCYRSTGHFLKACFALTKKNFLRAILCRIVYLKIVKFFGYCVTVTLIIATFKSFRLIGSTMVFVPLIFRYAPVESLYCAFM